MTYCLQKSSRDIDRFPFLEILNVKSFLLS